MFNRDGKSIAGWIAAIFVAAIASVWAIGAFAEDQSTGPRPVKDGDAVANKAQFAPAGGNELVQLGSMILAASKSHKCIYGYSSHTGRWEKVRLAAPIKEFAPVCSDGVGCIIVGREAYAFSGRSGRWDSIEIGGNADLVPTVSDDGVQIEVGTKICEFSAELGRWATVDLSVDSD